MLQSSRRQCNGEFRTWNSSVSEIRQVSVSVKTSNSVYEGRLKNSWTHLITPSRKVGGAVTVSFSKDLLWQAIHFLQRSTHFSKTCCRPFDASFRRIVEQAVLTS
jgi:hypothetical protein